MSDKIIFNNKVYGNTLNTKMAIVAKQQEMIDDDGTYIYTIEDPVKTDTVEIAKGGRIRYGSNSLETVVCQGIKMTYGNSVDIRDMFIQGLIRPTDLYTAFDMKIGFAKKPETFDWDKQTKIISEHYNLEAVKKSGNLLHCIFTANDMPENTGKLTEQVFESSMSPQSAVGLPGTRTIMYRDNGHPFPATYGRAIYAIEDFNYRITLNTFDYVGVYFIVNDVIRTGPNTIYVQSANSNTDDTDKYDFKLTDFEGYASIYPSIVQLKKFNQNTIPAFYIPSSYTLPTVEEGATGTANDGYIVSVKSNNRRDFYTWHNSTSTFEPFKKSDLTAKEFLYYYGDVTISSETSPSVTRHPFNDDDNLQAILHELLGDNLTIIDDSSNFIPCSYVVGNTSGDTKVCFTIQKKLSYETQNNCSVRVDMDDNNNYTFWLLTDTDRTQYYINCPMNRAELNFALGVREDLQYITKEEYDQHVNGGEENE